MKGLLRISRVRKPRATLLAILMLGGVYCTLGLWVYNHNVLDGNLSQKVAEQQVMPKIDEQIEQLAHLFVTAAAKPSTNIIRFVHSL